VSATGGLPKIRNTYNKKNSLNCVSPLDLLPQRMTVQISEKPVTTQNRTAPHVMYLMIWAGTLVFMKINNKRNLKK
jgi:hypothetical protein